MIQYIAMNLVPIQSAIPATIHLPPCPALSFASSFSMVCRRSCSNCIFLLTGRIFEYWKVRFTYSRAVFDNRNSPFAWRTYMSIVTLASYYITVPTH